MHAQHHSSAPAARLIRVLTALITALAAIAAAATCAVAAAPAAHIARRHLTPISAGAAFVLPPAGTCVSGHQLSIALRKVAHVTWRSATVKVNGRVVRTLSRTELAAGVTLHHLPSRRFVVSISAKATDGRRVTATRTFSACAPKPVTPAPPATPAPPVPVSSHLPGSYSGYGGGDAVSFYVSPDGGAVQDVLVNDVYLPCAPGGSLRDHIGIGQIPVAADGSFSATTTQAGVINNTPATYTYTFSGQFNATNVTGSFREDISYNNGTSYTCTSNPQSWTTSRDAQGIQTPSSPPPGSYSGYGGGDAVSFYVSQDGGQLQDVFVNDPYLPCAPGSSLRDHISIGAVAIAADGSFTSVTHQTGIVNDASTAFTYTFSGHGASSAGTERLAGTFREDVSYTSGASYSCSTDDQAWSVTRDVQGAQTSVAPAPGSYSGYGGGDSVTFNVAADATQLQNVSVANVYLECTPSGSVRNAITIGTVPVAADGSFNTTTTQSGVINSSPATLTYTFSGHVHGPSSSGVARLAGTFREDITYGTGTTTTCTSDQQSWSVTRSGS
jgi:hypothetical protein